VPIGLLSSANQLSCKDINVFELCCVLQVAVRCGSTPGHADFHALCIARYNVQKQSWTQVEHCMHADVDYGRQGT